MINGYNFVPSPIIFDYDLSYSALANESGRMQYYINYKNGKRARIGRNEFVSAYNSKNIVAVEPIPGDASAFQLQFFIKQ